MQSQPQKRHIVDILFVLVLFGVFTFCALVLVVLGANVYKGTVSDMGANFESRTACAYITEKVRQNDLYDSIYIDSFEGTSALVLTQEIYGSLYGTYIYFHNGELKELFMRIGSNIGKDPLAAGTTIMELKDFKIENINEKLLCITLITSEYETKTVYISTHSTRKGGFQ